MKFTLLIITVLFNAEYYPIDIKYTKFDTYDRLEDCFDNKVSTVLSIEQALKNHGLAGTRDKNLINVTGECILTK